MAEAAYPYQIVGDMAYIASGQHHRLRVFAPDNEGREISPGHKAKQIADVLASRVLR